MTSAEYRAILKCKSLLVKQLAHDLPAIVNELVSEGLISVPASKKMKTMGIGDDSKANDLMDQVVDRIYTNPGRFYEFVEILKHDRSREDLVSLLQRTLQECQDNKQANRSLSFSEDTFEEAPSFRNYPKRVRSGSFSSLPPRRISSSSTSSSSQWMCGEEVCRDQPNLGPNGGGGVRTPLLEPSSSVLPQCIDMATALEIIKDTREWRSLGTQLGIKSSKLDEIARFRGDEKSRLMKAWFECDECPTADKLRCALKKPSVGEIRAAERAARLSRTDTFGSSIDTTVSRDCPLESNGTNGDLVKIPFTEANVLDAITKVSNLHELGLRLGLEPYKMADIEQQPVEDRRQLLVWTFFQTVKHEHLNWEWVNAVIKDMEIQSWTQSRSDSMKKSISSDAPEPVPLFEKMREAGKDSIVTAHTTLERAIKKKLKQVVEPEDMDDFCTHIIKIFHPEEVSRLLPASPEVKDIDRIFRILTEHHMWGFSDISKLKSIADSFLEDDASITKKIREYNSKLSGYWANTKIVDRIQEDAIKEYGSDEDESSIREKPEKYNAEFRKKLSVQLFKAEKGRNLNMESLVFVEKIWRDLCEEFKLSLTSVLDKIVEHCIEISWYIPSHSAQAILERISGAVGFLQKKYVSNLLLEGVPIYSESCGVASMKTLEEVKLLLAVQDRNTERTLTLLKSFSGDLNLQMATKNDMTVLMIAAHGGCTEMVSALLKQGAEVNSQDVDGWSALFYATDQGHLDGMNCLLEHGADVSLISKTGSSVLDVARKHGDSPDVYNTLKSKLEHQLVSSAKEGDLNLVKRILRIGADVDALDPNKVGWTSLMWASWRGHIDVVRHLFQYQSNANATAKVGWTPLILSSREGHVEVMKALLDHGANIDQKTEEEWSSLMMAANFGRTEAGKVLLERGAKIDCISKRKYTPLAVACQNGHHDFVNMLIEYEPNLNLDIEAEGSWTPLMLACKNGHLKTAELLLREGANVDYKKKDLINALHIAASAGKNDLVRLMINWDADVDSEDENGKTALLHAAKDGHLEVIKTLIYEGHADLNFQEKEENYTALFFAVECRQNNVLDCFLRNENLDLNVTDRSGNTLLELAEQKNQQAFQLIRDKYRDKMERMRAYRRELNASTSGRPQGLTAKRAQDSGGVTAMLSRMNVSVGKPALAASAA